MGKKSVDEVDESKFWQDANRSTWKKYFVRGRHHRNTISPVWISLALIAASLIVLNWLGWFGSL